MTLNARSVAGLDAVRDEFCGVVETNSSGVEAACADLLPRLAAQKGLAVRLILVLAISILLSGAVYANARWDTRTLVQATHEAGKVLEKLFAESVQNGPSWELEVQLRRDVLGPLEAAMYEWFETSMKFGDGDDNPYRPFMDCYDLADQMKLLTIQLIRFHSGRLTGDQLAANPEQVEVELDACTAALKDWTNP